MIRFWRKAGAEFHIDGRLPTALLELVEEATEYIKQRRKWETGASPDFYGPKGTAIIVDAPTQEPHDE